MSFLVRCSLVPKLLNALSFLSPASARTLEFPQELKSKPSTFPDRYAWQVPLTLPAQNNLSLLLLNFCTNQYPFVCQVTMCCFVTIPLLFFPTTIIYFFPVVELSTFIFNHLDQFVSPLTSGSVYYSYLKKRGRKGIEKVVTSTCTGTQLLQIHEAREIYPFLYDSVRNSARLYRIAGLLLL